MFFCLMPGMINLQSKTVSGLVARITDLHPGDPGSSQTYLPSSSSIQYTAGLGDPVTMHCKVTGAPFLWVR